MKRRYLLLLPAALLAVVSFSACAENEQVIRKKEKILKANTGRL
jgi:outer membrane protein assembly factor BamE (lipoprotein component of BamABCDE complex)